MEDQPEEEAGPLAQDQSPEEEMVILKPSKKLYSGREMLKYLRDRSEMKCQSKPEKPKPNRAKLDPKKAKTTSKIPKIREPQKVKKQTSKKIVLIEGQGLITSNFEVIGSQNKSIKGGQMTLPGSMNTTKEITCTLTKLEENNPGSEDQNL